MDFFDAMKIVLRQLFARKGRSFLTILGIIIGVAGVIIIIALGAGAQSLILGQITKLGSNLLAIQPGKSNEKGPPAQVFGVVITTLINDDETAIKDSSAVPHITAVSAIVRGAGSVTWQNKTIDTTVTGTDYGYTGVVDVAMQEGQFIDQQQDQGNANVAVLGSSVSNELFGGTGVNPIGQVVKVKSSSQAEAGGIPLRIIGVIQPRGILLFQDMDDQIYAPLNIVQKQVLGIHYLQQINVKVDSSNNVDQVISNITNLLKQRHHIQRDVDVDFTIRSAADAISLLGTITDALRLFLTSMAAISLIVGGIGILNIMMSTVAERTREIGLRKAVGATNMAIRRQFLLEAGFLTFFGGIIGIVFGTIISYLMALAIRYSGYDWAFVVSFSSIALAVGVSVLTGIIFGLYPAFKAAKLNPIDALRYE